MWHQGKRHERTRFILRHGLVPWGVSAGACAAFGSVLSVRDQRMGDRPVPLGVVVGIAVVCFITWSAFAGWAVGAVRWDLRQAGNHGRAPGDLRR